MRGTEYTNNVDVILNALCYAFEQGDDWLDVIYLGASDDAELHFLQVQQLARVILQHYETCSDAAKENCHWWSQRIIDVAQCETLDDYKKL